MLLNNSGNNCNNNKFKFTDSDLRFIRVLRILSCFQEMGSTSLPVAQTSRLLK